MNFHSRLQLFRTCFVWFILHAFSTSFEYAKLQINRNSMEGFVLNVLSWRNHLFRHTNEFYIPCGRDKPIEKEETKYIFLRRGDYVAKYTGFVN
uniref:Uncharacterized protein n=1 Tax=Onchocerca volvulus TaxID=6282 RepID=A0A8R1XSI6_ONCVO